MNSLFLETTIQADRIVSFQERKITVAANLVGKTIISSKTVLGEFINTFVHDAVVFYNLLVDSRTTQEALKRLIKYRDRVSKRSIEILGSIADEWGWDKNDVQDGLERWIEWELVHRFSEGLALIIEGVNCTKASAIPLKDGDIYRIEGLSCTKELAPNCLIIQFVDTHKNDILNIIKYLEQIVKKDKEQQRSIETSKDIISGVTTPFGRACLSVKDIIIALETPVESEIYTTNVNHFEPICKVLGKALFIEKAIV